MVKFFRFLSDLRAVKQISEEEMARAIGVTTSRLQLIERGAAMPPPESFIAYSNALGLPLEQLVFYFINDFCSDFCRKAGLTRRFQIYFDEEDVCGTWSEKVAALRYATPRASLSRPSDETRTTESSPSWPMPR